MGCEKWADIAGKMDCYIPNNPQFGISLECTTQITQNFANFPTLPCDTGQDFCCDAPLSDECNHLGGLNKDYSCENCEKTRELSSFRDFPCEDCEGDRDSLFRVGSCGDCDGNVGFNLDEDVNCDQTDVMVNSPVGGYWSPDDLSAFSIPTLDVEPLPNLLQFSPGHKSLNPERTLDNNGEVLVSLKHSALVHPTTDCTTDNMHPTQMVVPPSSGYTYYDQYTGSTPALFPTMSVNVSMNMTMHGYPHEQMCSQMQWNQNQQTVNMMYPQSQNMLSPTYQGPTYSFTADFRGPPQADPLMTPSPFKPIQISNAKTIFPKSPCSQNGYSVKTRSKVVLENCSQSGYQVYGQSGLDNMDCGYATCDSERPCSGKVQIGALSGCSGSEDELKPNLCRICGKTYARPSTLKTHLRTHSGERPYRCGDCNKSFSQAANLTAHVRTHTGQKPFRCPICDRRFSQSSSVTTHMRTHSGERPYRCRACKKAFSDSSTLTKHLRIHSGEKPYQCKLCLLRFSQSGNLNRHMRVHGQSAGTLLD